MGKESFIIRKSFYKPISKLSDKQLGKLFRAIFMYQLGEVVEVDGDIEMAFDFFKNQFEMDEAKYQSIVERNQNNGRKGGAPKKANAQLPKSKDVEKNSNNPNNPLGFLEPNVTIYDKDNDYDNDYINRDSKEESLSEGKIPHAEEKVDFDALIDFFNKETKGVFGIIRQPLSEKRKGMVKARINSYGKQTFLQMISKAYESPFLKGQNPRGWRASFDWLIKPSNFEKVISGNYDNNGYQGYSSGNANAGIGESFYKGIAEGIARADFEQSGKG